MIDRLRELLTTALEANLSLIAVAQNEAMKRLAGWAAIIAVPTMIAGIYGMNFKFMPELRLVPRLPDGDGPHAGDLRVSLLQVQALGLALSSTTVARHWRVGLAPTILSGG